MTILKEIVNKIISKSDDETTNISCFRRRDYTSKSSNSKVKQQDYDRVTKALNEQIEELENINFSLYPDSISSSTSVLEFKIHIDEKELENLYPKMIKIIKTNAKCSHGSIGTKDF